MRLKSMQSHIEYSRIISQHQSYNNFPQLIFPSIRGDSATFVIITSPGMLHNLLFQNHSPIIYDRVALYFLWDVCLRDQFLIGNAISFLTAWTVSFDNLNKKIGWPILHWRLVPILFVLNGNWTIITAANYKEDAPLWINVFKNSPSLWKGKFHASKFTNGTTTNQQSNRDSISHLLVLFIMMSIILKPILLIWLVLYTITAMMVVVQYHPIVHLNVSPMFW